VEDNLRTELFHLRHQEISFAFCDWRDRQSFDSDWVDHQEGTIERSILRENIVNKKEQTDRIEKEI
jgi:hypothetical protein